MTNDGIVQWDISTGAIVRQFKIDETRSSTMSRAFARGSISVSLDGQYLLAQSIDLKCTIWNLKTGAITKRFSAAAISPDWRRLAVEAPGKGAEVRDADTDRQIGNVVGAGLSLGTLTFSPDGRLIGAIGADGAVMLWKVEDGSLVREFLKKQKPARAVAFAGDGHRVVTGNDAGLQLWDEAKLIRLLPSTGAVMAIAWASDGNALLAGRADRTIDIWDATKGEVTQRFVLSGVGGGYGNVTSVGFGIDENMVLGANGTIAEIFDRRTGATVKAFGGAFSAAFSRDGRRIVTGGDSVAVWDVETGAILRKMQIPIATYAVTFSPSGTRIASGGDDGSVMLWDAQSGVPVHILKGHRGNVRVVAFSPDGQTLLSGGFDHKLKLWSAERGGFIRDLDGHQGWVRAVSFAPDGKRIMSVGDDGTARLWDTDTGRLLITTLMRNGDWLSVTPEGLFATSGDPQEFLAIVRGFDVLPMSEFILRNRRDSLAALFSSIK
jgi:WD40 repeat protein